MEMNEKVLTALEVLTDCAENDFELYRICELVRDLTDPPKVEIIDETHQKFNGLVYYKVKSNHYMKNEPLHRVVFRYYFGDIPQGYEIHHADWNHENNDAENLQLKTEQEHKKIHMKRDGHEKNYARTIKTFVCECCGKTFTAQNTGQNRFCSEKCRNYNKHHCIKKICAFCGKEFYTDVTEKAKYCSQNCAGKAKSCNGRETRICPICGKSFETHKSSHTITCSKECGHKMIWKTRRRDRKAKVV